MWDDILYEADSISPTEGRDNTEAENCLVLFLITIMDPISRNQSVIGLLHVQELIYIVWAIDQSDPNTPLSNNG